MTRTRAAERTTSAQRAWIASLVTLCLGGVVGCRDGQTGQPAPIIDNNAGADPSMTNMAEANAGVQPGSMQPVYAKVPSGGRVTYPRTPVSRGTAPQLQVAGQAYTAPMEGPAGTYPQNQQPSPQGYPQPYDPNATAQDDQLYAELLDPNTPEAQQPPPPLPVYEQPPAPGPDYLWTPGYWDYANAGYYYVPGNWVAAPFVGALWTPGWWGNYGSGYRWHRGYWGRHVGYYGGVNYGFGFIGFGYQGGYWNRDHFYYNSYVNHVRPEAVNNYVYNRRVTVVNNTYINNTRVSYYGGPGGLSRRATPAEFAAVRETHLQPLPGQVDARQQAMGNRQQFFADNHGRPKALFASNPVVQHNVAVPPQLLHPQTEAGQFQQQHLQAEQQRQQQQQQFRANEQQQRLQAEQQRQQQNQAFRNNEQQQRLQVDGQHQQQQQAFRANEQQQHIQAEQQRQQQNQQFRANEQQQRLQADGQRQQQEQVMRQQQDAQRQQLQQQRAQQDQQRIQQQTQRQQQDQQRQQQDAQRQQLQQQRAQQEQQHSQQQAFRLQQDQQRQQQQQTMHQQQDLQRQQIQQQQRTQIEQQHAAQQAQHEQVQVQHQQIEQHQAAPASHGPETPHGGGEHHGPH